MDSALLVHRLHFAFTVTFHYLFHQPTMGLAPLIVVLKTLGLGRNDEIYNQAARFWDAHSCHQLCDRCGDGHSHGVSGLCWPWGYFVFIFRMQGTPRGWRLLRSEVSWIYHPRLILFD